MTATKGYLRVKNFWHYQNADAWKKAQESQRGHPIWFKHFVHRDLVAYKTEARVAEHRRLVHGIEPIEGRAVA